MNEANNLMEKKVCKFSFSIRQFQNQLVWSGNYNDGDYFVWEWVWRLNGIVNELALC